MKVKSTTQMTKAELLNLLNEKNTIIFNEGLNIIIGDNNGGKTKLHNALRYMLSDLVILDLNNKVELYVALY